MQTIRVHIIQRHIDDGTPCACYICPIAQSLSEIFGPDWRARVTSYISMTNSTTGLYLSAPTPKAANDFIVLFDSAHRAQAQPFHFDLALDGPAPGQPLHPVLVTTATHHYNQSNFLQRWFLLLPTPTQRTADDLLAIANTLGIAWWTATQDPSRCSALYRHAPTFRQRGYRLLISQPFGFTV